MRTNFVLIDAENVKLEHVERLKHEHFRVVVFVGTNLKRLSFPIVNAIQSLGANGSYIQINGQGPNALDLHLAYYIGRLASVHPDAYFHIISQDKGFDPLIKHLKDQKIFCSRSDSVLEIPLVRSTDKLSPKLLAEDFFQKRIVSSKARPATVMTLQRAILAHFHNMLSGEEVAAVLKELVAAGHVVVTGKKVAYRVRD